LGRAQSLYDRAIAEAGLIGRANDLLARLQDELPHYGEWQANRPDGMDESFEDLLNGAAELASRIDELPNAKDEQTETAASNRVPETIEKLEPALGQAAADSRVAVDRATRKSSEPTWREIDALLRLPMIAAEDRLILLDRIATPEPPPAGDA